LEVFFEGSLLAITRFEVDHIIGVTSHGCRDRQADRFAGSRVPTATLSAMYIQLLIAVRLGGWWSPGGHQNYEAKI
jgi:hypothetical protein